MRSPDPTTAIVLSTFNRPRALVMALAGLSAQTDLSFEVVIADDGSGPETTAVIEGFARDAPFRVRRFWQENLGFRKARILNEAVRATDAELLIFLDQDAVAVRDLVASHRAAHASNRFLAGGVVLLAQAESEALDPAKVRAGGHEALITLRRRWRLRIRHLENLFFTATSRKDRPRLYGMNFAVARDLFERVNGFDEAYEGWGKEDSDLRTRMRRAGGQARCLWNRAVVCHVWHPIAFNPIQFQENRGRYRQAIEGARPWRCERGLRAGAPAEQDRARVQA